MPDFGKVKSVTYLCTIFNKDYVRVVYKYGSLKLRYIFAIDTNNNHILSANLSAGKYKSHLEYFQVDDLNIRLPSDMDTISYLQAYMKQTGLRNDERLPFQGFFEAIGFV